MKSKELAWKIKRHGIEMTHLSKGSHIGAILSVADIVAVLYSDILKYDHLNPKDDNRDRVILSKGHAGAAIYAALAECGFFNVEELSTHYADGSRLSGHVSHKGVPGVEFSTGSLGHGLPVGSGMALAAKKDNKNHKVIVILGDGECDEGSIWEAALFANHYKLSNLTVIIDHNKMQSLTFCEDTISKHPFAEKWRAFGWNVIEVDGHNHEELKSALQKNNPGMIAPTCIIAHTIKGKGISFMENNILWHYRTPQGEEYEAALRELEADKPCGILS
jgi:transketolase